MMDTRRVVVVFTPEVRTHKETGLVVARFVTLGLTGYGETEEDALSSLKRLLRLCIETHRKQGTLEQVLDRQEVPWSWESAYDGSTEVERLYDSLENGNATRQGALGLRELYSVCEARKEEALAAGLRELYSVCEARKEEALAA